MLDRLDKVPWSELGHAYGAASDVPDQIRALASKDNKKREQALWQLYGNIFHQGTRYEAAPYAVPFLYELLNEDSTREKHEIIYLLVSLALGYPQYYLPNGINVKSLHGEFDEFRNDTDVICYDVVYEGLLTLIQLLAHKHRYVRRASAYALSWFPEAATLSLPEIERLLSVESHVHDLANAILSNWFAKPKFGCQYELIKGSKLPVA